MEWTDGETLLLIEEYKSRPCLWDTGDDSYKLHNKKKEAWVEIAGKMQCDVQEVKKKINSLLASFRRERAKEGKMRLIGRTSEVYHSAWFAFKPLGFLLDKFHAKKRKLEDEDSIEEGPTEERSEINARSTHISNRIRTMNVEEEHIVIKNESKIPRLANDETETIEVSNCMKSLLEFLLKRDEFSIFGEHVANKLRDSGRTQQEISIAQHHISEICYRLIMGEYSCS